MSTTITFPYTTPANYTFDTDDIEVTGGVAKLKLQTSSALTFNQPFTADTGFTYSASDIEFSGGLMQQLDQAPTDALLAAKFTSDDELDWAVSGSFTGTVNGTPTISSGKLDCTGNAQKGVYWDNVNVTNGTAAAALKFRYTPNYTTSPPNNINIAGLEVGTGSNNDRLILTHSPSGTSTMRITLNDSSGTQIYLATTIGGLWSFTNGQEYEFELNWDSSSGDIRLFIDGALHGTLNSAGAWTRGTNAVRLYVGAQPEIYNLADATFDDVILFSSVQHTSAYTAGYTIPDNKYTEAAATLPVFDHTTSNQGTITSLDAFSSTDTNAPQFSIDVGGGGFMYWTGSAWASSDGTFAQSSTEADINTNIGTFPSVSGETQVTVKVHFDEQNIDADQMSIDDMTITYTGQTQYPTDNPTIVTNSTFKASDLEDFTATETKAGSDEIKYVITASGQDRYVTGGSAADSDGTYAQASTATEMDSDIGNIISARKTIAITAFLHSDDGTTTPELDLLSIIYNAALADPSTPTLVEVEGFIYDANGPVASQTVRVRPFEAGYFNDGIFHKYQYDTIATTDADGYFNGNVYFQGSGKAWDFKIGTQSYKVELLDQAEMDLKDAPTFVVIEI